MAKMGVAEVYRLAYEAGLKPERAAVATAIAIAESGLDPAALGDVGIQTATWGPSVGLWQIRSLKAESGKGTSRDATRLTRARFNAKTMADISAKGTNFGPWSTYKNGAYKTHMPRVVDITGVSAYAGGNNPGSVTAPTPTRGTSGSGVVPVGLEVPNPLDSPLNPFWTAEKAEDGMEWAGDKIEDGILALVQAMQRAAVFGSVLGLGIVLVSIGAWRTVSK